jgi:hypothetical protein
VNFEGKSDDSISDDEIQGGQICPEFIASELGYNFMSYFVMFVILFVNYINRYRIVILIFVRILIERLIKFDKITTFTSLSKTIMLVIFLIHFLFTAFALLLANASFKEVWMPLDFVFSTNLYPDFTREWYNQVGAIYINLLCIMAFFPLFEFLLMVNQPL